MSLRKTVSKAAVVVIASVLTYGSATAADSLHAGHASAAISSQLTATQGALRDLWIGHIFRVREVVRSLAANDASHATLVF